VFPVLIFASFALTATVGSLDAVERVRETNILSAGVDFTLTAVPLLSIILGFTLVYKYMPYTCVRFLPALLAGGVAGSTAYLLQWAFIKLQIGVTSNNLIYGTFAALPIFLAWLNTSWIIVLAGCEITYAVQHESSYQPSVSRGLVSISQRERAALQVLVRVCKRSIEGLPPESPGAIAAVTDLPRPVITEIIETLVRRGMLSRSAKPEGALLPADDLSRECVGNLLLGYRQAGEICHGDLGGFLDETVCAFHDKLEDALRREGSLRLSVLGASHRE
jgi:membrane protein